MQCELCGKKEAEFSALIEGVELQVCEGCARHGQVLKKPVYEERKQFRAEEPELVIVEDYASLIKNKRESMGLNQEDFAKKLNQRLSLMQSIESGHIKPTIEVARKLEKILGIKLIKELKFEKADIGKKSSDLLTIGDIIKNRK